MSFDTLDPEQMRQALRALQADVARKDEIIQRHERESAFKQATIDRSTCVPSPLTVPQRRTYTHPQSASLEAAFHPWSECNRHG